MNSASSSVEYVPATHPRIAPFDKGRQFWTGFAPSVLGLRDQTLRRAQFFGLYKYSGIRRILQDALDLEPLPALVVPQHGALTQPRFARNVEELLAKHLEEAPYESH